MSTIQFWASEGEFGVFTDPSDGAVFAGSHVNGCARVGVNTFISGTACFTEYDADGKRHGRDLRCCADGNTWYRLCDQ